MTPLSPEDLEGLEAASGPPGADRVRAGGERLDLVDHETGDHETADQEPGSTQDEQRPVHHGRRVDHQGETGRWLGRRRQDSRQARRCDHLAALGCPDPEGGEGDHPGHRGGDGVDEGRVHEGQQRQAEGDGEQEAGDAGQGAGEELARGDPGEAVDGPDLAALRERARGPRPARSRSGPPGSCRSAAPDSASRWWPASNPVMAPTSTRIRRKTSMNSTGVPAFRSAPDRLLGQHPAPSVPGEAPGPGALPTRPDSPSICQRLQTLGDWWALPYR